MVGTEIHLEKIEGFHIAGEVCRLKGFPENTRFDCNGLHMVGQMYAQYFQLARPRRATPLALWHGGGLTGASWETAPDGQAGWLDYFLRAGFSVALCDAFERGRAGLPAFPQAVDGAPEYRSLESIWHHFRFGPPLEQKGDLPWQSLRAASYPGQQFPVEHIAQFGRQFVPRFTHTDRQSLAAYQAFLERMGLCVVIGHSQGGMFALQAALACAHRIRAVVALEPPVSQVCFERLEAASNSKLPPHLIIFGDFIRGVNATWEPYLIESIRYCHALEQRGTPARIVELPERGIRGNSHMLQMDANARQIARLVEEWLLSLD